MKVAHGLLRLSDLSPGSGLLDVGGGDPGDRLGDGRLHSPAPVGDEVEGGPARHRAAHGRDLVRAEQREPRLVHRVAAEGGVVRDRFGADFVPHDVVGRIAPGRQVASAHETTRIGTHEQWPVGPAPDEVAVEPAALDHDVRERERQRRIGSRAHAQPVVGFVRQAGAGQSKLSARGASERGDPSPRCIFRGPQGPGQDACLTRRPP